MESWSKLPQEFQCEEVKPYYVALKKNCQDFL